MADPLAGILAEQFWNAFYMVAIIGIGFLLAYAIYKYLPRLLKPKTGKAVLIFDIARRRVKLEAAEEVSPGILKTETGDIVIVPSDSEVFTVKSGRNLLEAYPVVRLGKKLAAVPASRFLELQVIGKYAGTVRDAPELILSLLETNAIQESVKISPGAEIAVTFKPSEVAKAAVELLESESDELLGAMMKVTMSKQEFEALLRSLLAYEHAKQASIIAGSLRWVLILVGAGIATAIAFSVLGGGG